MQSCTTRAFCSPTKHGFHRSVVSAAFGTIHFDEFLGLARNRQNIATLALRLRPGHVVINLVLRLALRTFDGNPHENLTNEYFYDPISPLACPLCGKHERRHREQGDDAELRGVLYGVAIKPTTS